MKKVRGKNAELDEFGSVLLWIAFFLILAFAVYYLVKSLTGIN